MGQYNIPKEEGLEEGGHVIVRKDIHIDAILRMDDER